MCEKFSIANSFKIHNILANFSLLISFLNNSILLMLFKYFVYIIIFSASGVQQPTTTTTLNNFNNKNNYCVLLHTELKLLFQFTYAVQSQGHLPRSYLGPCINGAGAYSFCPKCATWKHMLDTLHLSNLSLIIVEEMRNLLLKFKQNGMQVYTLYTHTILSRFLNELTLLICSYFLFLFTDFVGDANTRFMIGWAFVGLAAFNILVNWCALLYKVGTAVRGVIRGLLQKQRIQKYLQEKQKRLEETAAQPLQMETVEATSPASPVKKRKLSKKMNIKVKKGVQDGVSTDEAPTPNKKGQRQRTVSDNLEATIDKQKKISIDDQTPQHQRLPTNDEVLNFDGFETQQPPIINKTTQEIGVSPVNQATPGLATSTTPVQIQNNEIPARSPKKKGKKSKKTNTLQKGEETPLDPQQDFMDQVAKAINHGIGFKPRPINYRIM